MKDMLLNEIALARTATQTVKTIDQFGFEVLKHIANNPDFIPSDYHTFGSVKNGFQCGQ